MYHQFNIQQFYVLPTQYIYVFCVGLRTNSDYFPIQHWLAGFCNIDEKCLQRGTHWIFNLCHDIFRVSVQWYWQCRTKSLLKASYQPSTFTFAYKLPLIRRTNRWIQGPFQEAKLLRQVVCFFVSFNPLNAELTFWRRIFSSNFSTSCI